MNTPLFACLTVLLVGCGGSLDVGSNQRGDSTPTPGSSTTPPAEAAPLNAPGQAEVVSCSKLPPGGFDTTTPEPARGLVSNGRDLFLSGGTDGVSTIVYRRTGDGVLSTLDKRNHPDSLWLRGADARWLATVHQVHVPNEESGSTEARDIELIDLTGGAKQNAPKPRPSDHVGDAIARQGAVYYSTLGPSDGLTTLSRFDGKAASVLVSNLPYRSSWTVSDDGDVYVVMVAKSDAELVRVTVAGTSTTLKTFPLAQRAVTPALYGVSAGRVYFRPAMDDSWLVDSLKIDGSDERHELAAAATIRNIQIGKAHLFFQDDSVGKVFRVAKGGGKTEVVVNDAGAVQFALDDCNLYWASGKRLMGRPQ